MKIPLSIKLTTFLHRQLINWRPKLKRGEYEWKATVYEHKFKPGAADVELYSERFNVKPKAIAFKKSVEAGKAQRTVRYEQVSIIEFDGWMG